MKEPTWATCSSETQREQYEDAAFEAQVLERWLDDGGARDSAPDGENLADKDVLNQFHIWKPQARVFIGKPAPAFTKLTSDVARDLARALKR